MKKIQQALLSLFLMLVALSINASDNSGKQEITTEHIADKIKTYFADALKLKSQGMVENGAVLMPDGKKAFFHYKNGHVGCVGSSNSCTDRHFSCDDIWQGIISQTPENLSYEVSDEWYLNCAFTNKVTGEVITYTGATGDVNIESMTFDQVYQAFEDKIEESKQLWSRYNKPRSREVSRGNGIIEQMYFNANGYISSSHLRFDENPVMNGLYDIGGFILARDHLNNYTDKYSHKLTGQSFFYNTRTGDLYRLLQSEIDQNEKQFLQLAKELLEFFVGVHKQDLYSVEKSEYGHGMDEKYKASEYLGNRPSYTGQGDFNKSYSSSYIIENKAGLPICKAGYYGEEYQYISQSCLDAQTSDSTHVDCHDIAYEFIHYSPFYSSTSSLFYDHSFQTRTNVNGVCHFDYNKWSLRYDSRNGDVYVVDKSDLGPNFDDDSLADALDLDDDNDGVFDDVDAFPFDANESSDIDGDGIGDNADVDLDGDGIIDTNDDDIDGDGVTNNDDPFPYDPSESHDFDLDGTGDNADLDDDNDGVLDRVDAFPLNRDESADLDGDGIGDNADLDVDGDNVANNRDRFPYNPSESHDFDLDGTGDNADLDDDNDGVLDSVDAFPLNRGESADLDGDGIGNNADLDADGDGVDNRDDLFPYNALEYADFDADGLGDNADKDDDGDGIPDAEDAKPLFHAGKEVPEQIKSLQVLSNKEYVTLLWQKSSSTNVYRQHIFSNSGQGEIDFSRPWTELSSEHSSYSFRVFEPGNYQYVVRAVNGFGDEESNRNSVNIRVLDYVLELLPFADFYPDGDAIALKGRVLDDNDDALSNIEVSLSIEYKSSKRTVTVYSGDDGSFNFPYYAVEGNAGDYKVRATAYVKGLEKSAISYFKVADLKLSPKNLELELSMNSQYNTSLTLFNNSDIDLSGLNMNIIEVTAESGLNLYATSVLPATLDAGEQVQIELGLTAPTGEAPQDQIKFAINISNDQGLFTQSKLNVKAVQAIGKPVASFAKKQLALNPGQSDFNTLRIKNQGYAPINVSAYLDNANLPWVTLQNSAEGLVGIGEEKAIIVKIQAPVDLPLGNHTLAIELNVDGKIQILHTPVSITSATFGEVHLRVEDDDGQWVNGVVVSLTRQVASINSNNGHETAHFDTFNARTNMQGQVDFTELPAGKYTYIINSPDHYSLEGELELSVGENPVQTFLLRKKMLELTFSVEEILEGIEDVYQVETVVEYATSIIKPSLQSSPYELRFLIDGRKQDDGTLRLKNTSSTTPLYNVELDASSIANGDDRINFYFANQSQYQRIDFLAANESIDIPVFVEAKGDADLSSKKLGEITITGDYAFTKASGEIGKSSTQIEIPVNHIGLTLPEEPPCLNNSCEPEPSEDESFVGDDFDLPSLYYKQHAERFNDLIFDGNSLRLWLKNNRASALFELTSQKLKVGHFVGEQFVELDNLTWTGHFNQPHFIDKQDDTLSFDINSLETALESYVINDESAFSRRLYIEFTGQWADRDELNSYHIALNLRQASPPLIIKDKQAKVSFTCSTCDNRRWDVISPPVANADGEIALKLEQSTTLSRQAFNAVLELNSVGEFVSDISAKITIKNNQGEDASSLFHVIETSNSLNHTNSIGSKREETWQIVPRSDAGGTMESGNTYDVAAVLTYQYNGEDRELVTNSTKLTVLPLPALSLDYILPRTVVAGIEAEVALVVTNTGFGLANNVKVDAFQPTILSNEDNVPIGFSLHNGIDENGKHEKQDKNTLFTLGNLLPGESKTLYFKLLSSRDGHITDASAVVKHQAYKAHELAESVYLDPLITSVNMSLSPVIAGRVFYAQCQNSLGFDLSVMHLGKDVSFVRQEEDEERISFAFYSQYSDDSKTLLLPGHYDLKLKLNSYEDIWHEQVLTLFAEQPSKIVTLSIGEDDYDSDGDAIPDCWELAYFGSLVPDGVHDNDLDGLSNLEEYSLGLNPADSDTDKDSISDSIEKNMGFDPLDKHDGVEPLETVSLYGDLDPNLPTVVLVHGLQGRLVNCSRLFEQDDCLTAPNPNRLWTGVGSNGATSLIKNALNHQANVVQLVWEGAFYDLPVPSMSGYLAARTNAHNAGAILAKQLLQKLGDGYSNKIHVISHSLGTAVSTYAIHHYLKANPSVERIQFTALDRPDRIAKIPDYGFDTSSKYWFAALSGSLLMYADEFLLDFWRSRFEGKLLKRFAGTEKNEEYLGYLDTLAETYIGDEYRDIKSLPEKYTHDAYEALLGSRLYNSVDIAYLNAINLTKSQLNDLKFGFNEDFFNLWLGDWLNSGKVLIDNYYSSDGLITVNRQDPLTITRSGVGDVAIGKNILNRNLEEPAYVGKLKFNDEGSLEKVAGEPIHNNHSGVHQFYRWSVMNHENCGDTYSIPDDWPSILPIAHYFQAGKYYPEVNDLSDLAPSKNWAKTLNPVSGGWCDSILVNPTALQDKINAVDSAHLPKPYVVKDVTSDPAAVKVFGNVKVDFEDNKPLIEIIEASSPMAVLPITLDGSEQYISFDFKVNDDHDGDFMGLLVNSDVIWKLEASSVDSGHYMNSGPVSLNGLGAGEHSLTIRLFGVGQSNAEFSVKNIKFLLKPEVGDVTTVLGDFNDDLQVDLNDVSLMKPMFGAELDADTRIFDLNNDGVINILDYRFLVKNCTFASCAVE